VKELPVSGVFVEIGLEPSSEIVSGLVRLNAKKEIPISVLARRRCRGFLPPEMSQTLPGNR